MTDFEEIWHEYYPGITVYLRTSFRFEDTDDLVQEIMFKIHRNLAKWDRKRSLKSWIYSIAHNHAVDTVRNKSAQFRLIETVKQQAYAAAAPDSPETTFLRTELYEGIGQFIENLPETERRTAFLRFHEDLSYREISRITGIAEGTLKYQVHSIKKKLAAYYGEKYED